MNGLVRPLILAGAVSLIACGAPGRSAGTTLQTTATPAADPCAGQIIDFDRAQAHCKVSERAMRQWPQGVEVTLIPPPPIHAGGKGFAEVRFTNKSNAPLRLIVNPGCDSFGVSILDLKGARADEEGDCAFGGLCGSAGLDFAVTLQPGAALSKRVEVRARKTRWIEQDKGCVSEEGGAIAAGQYRLEIGLPFSDPVDGKQWHRRPRKIAGRFEIVHR